MGDWRDRLSMNPAEIRELSIESMAATRIMKSIGSSAKNIGKVCARLGLTYNEEETTFQRAVNIFREVYMESSLLDFFDVHSGKDVKRFLDELIDDTRTGIVFYRDDNTRIMTSFVLCRNLPSSPLGQIIIKPGIKYVMCKNDMQIWEQDPVTLLKSFSKVEQE